MAKEHLLSVVSQDGAVILNIEAGRLSSLNSTGAYIWQALERGDETQSIVEEVARMTGEPIDVLQRDIADFIKTLAGENILP